MSRARRLAALGIGLLAAAGLLALGEQRLRAEELDKGLVVHPPDAPGLGWEYTPEALDVRMRPSAPPGHSGKRRIVVLGDSVTDGGGLAPEHTWPGQAQRLMAGRGQEVEFFNLAVFGYDACQIATQAQHRLEGWHPDLVVYASFTNDHSRTDLLYVGQERRPVYAGATVAELDLDPRLDPLLRLAAFRSWAGARKLHQGTEMLPEWDRYEGCMQELADTGLPLFQLLLHHHVLGLGDPDAIDEYLPRAYENQLRIESRYRATAERVGMPFASVFPTLSEQGRTFFQEGLEHDTAHPNAEGHAVFAEAFVEALRRYDAGEPQLETLGQERWKPPNPPDGAVGTPKHKLGKRGRKRPPKQDP